MKAQLIRTIIEWLWRRYPYLMKEIVVGPEGSFHVHKNPRKKAKDPEDAPRLRTRDEMDPPDEEEEEPPRMTRDDYDEMMQDLRREREDDRRSEGL